MFVIIHPHSNTNPTDKYRVLDSGDWAKFINGATTSYGYTTWDTYPEALAARDKANQS